MIKGDTIPAEETLLRRVFAKDKRYIDPSTGKPTSRAFSPRPKDEQKLSVDVKSLSTYAISIQDSSKFSLYSIEASLVLKLGLQCIYDPIIDPIGISNMAHSLVIGIPEEDESISGILARNSTYQAAY